MALLVTLFLVLVNIFNTVTTNTPKAEGLTAIEAWMLACILFVFGALTEYAFLLFKKGWDPDYDWPPDKGHGIRLELDASIIIGLSLLAMFLARVEKKGGRREEDHFL